MIRIIRIIILFNLVTLVSCGFHLRGEIKVPDILKEFYVVGNVTSNDLSIVLYKRIEQVGITRVARATETSSTLSITRNNFVRRVLTVDSSNKASAYKMDLVVAFEVIDNKGKTILKNQQLRQTREYNIDPLNALASGDQEKRLILEMTEFIVNQMLTRLSFAFKETS
jgi:LPS-assembly lipoprotein